jgi:hypothetical protein
VPSANVSKFSQISHPCAILEHAYLDEPWLEEILAIFNGHDFVLMTWH